MSRAESRGSTEKGRFVVTGTVRAKESGRALEGIAVRAFDKDFRNDDYLGRDTTDAGGRYAICPYGNPGMASAGTGDVLSGVIGAMAAQGLDPWSAATTGVLAHALAGDRAAGRIGERGLLASDITACLPGVLNPS